MLPLAMSVLAVCISSSESSAATAATPPIPLVQRIDNFPGTPLGYVAYEVRTWGTGLIGIADSIAYSPKSEYRISIQFLGNGGLVRQTNYGKLTPSIIFLRTGVTIDPRVLVLEAPLKVTKIAEPFAIKFLEDESKRTANFRAFSFRYPGAVFTGTITSVTIGKAGTPPRNPDGSWAGDLKLTGSGDEFFGRFSEPGSGELSVIRVPVGIEIPRELLGV